MRHDGAPATAAAEPSAAARAATALAVYIGILLLARLVLMFAPGMWLWGLNAQRFVEPVTGWIGWTLMAAALVSGIARRGMASGARLGDAIGQGGWGPVVIVAAAGAGLVLLIPDQVRFVGDFLLRQGTVEEGGRPGVLFPQALPLDVLLHHTVPLALADAGLLDANTSARLIGGVEAGLLGALAVAFARSLDLRGMAALGASAVVFFGGYLGMFTGYSKAFADLVVLVGAVGVFGLMVVRAGRELLPLGVAVALGVTLHRSALGLLPAAAFAWWLWLRRRAGEPGGAAAALRKPSIIAAAVIPLAALAIMLPRIVAVILEVDAVHFNPAEVEAGGGPLRAAFAGTRPSDMLSLVFMLSPLALASVAMVFSFGRALPRGRELLLLVLLAGPLLAFWPILHPVHGMFRDWDDFAFGGIALSLVVAWLVGEVLRGTEPRRSRGSSRPEPHGPAWIALPVVVAVAVPAVQWLGLHADVDRGLARVRAFVTEPPVRMAAHRAHTWDFLGIRNFRLERWKDSAEAFAHAAETSPSPRILHQWALAETRRGDLTTARRIYWRMLAASPENAYGWIGLAALSSQIGDINESLFAARRLLELNPSSAEGREVMRYWDSVPPAVRDSLARRYPPRDSTERGW